MATFICPNCKSVFNLTEEFLVKKVVCENCKTVIGDVNEQTLSYNAGTSELKQDIPLANDTKTMLWASPGAPSDSISELSLKELEKLWSATVCNTDTITQEMSLGKSFAEDTPFSTTIFERNFTEDGLDSLNPVEYKIIEKIGQGGMGTIFAARQVGLSRRVALKTITRGKEGEESQAKFVSEALVTGELDHPNIVPIHEIGCTPSGVYFYSMKEVKGKSWKELIKNKTETENLQILLNVCDAMAFSHDRGYIHRDLKPENIMLGEYGEVLVMDWGLAVTTNALGKAEKISPNMSHAGTPAYMAPEMASCAGELVGAWSDIYLLGGILFEIATGLRPHSGKDIYDCLRAATTNELPKVERDDELVKIAYKSLNSTPKKRYRTVKEFSEAIRIYLSHQESILLTQSAEKDFIKAEKDKNYVLFNQSLHAFQDATRLWQLNSDAEKGESRVRLSYAELALSRGDLDLAETLLFNDKDEHQELSAKIKQAKKERVLRQRRFRQLVVLSVTATLLIVGGALLSTFWIRSEQSNTLAEKKRVELEKEKTEKEKERAEAALELAKQAKTHAQKAQHQAEQALQETELAKKRAQKAQAQTELALEEAEKSNYLNSIQLAKVRISERAFGQTRDFLRACPVQFRHWEWGRLEYLCHGEIYTIKGQRGIFTVRFNPSQTRIITAGYDSKINIYDFKTGKEIKVITNKHTPMFCAIYSPDGKYILASGYEKTIRIYDANTGEEFKTLNGHTGSVMMVAYNSDGTKVVSASFDKTARVWDVKTGKEILKLEGHTDNLEAVAFSPDNKYILTGSKDKTARLWNATSAKEIKSYKVGGETVESVDFSPSGKLMLLCGDDNPQVRDVMSGNILFTLNGHKHRVLCGEFSPDGKTVITSSYDATTKIWNAENGSELMSVKRQTKPVTSVAYSPDGNYIVSGAVDKSVRLWHASAGLKQKTFVGHTNNIYEAIYSPDGSQMISTSEDNTTKIWDVKTAKEIFSVRSTSRMLVSRFSPDGKYFFIAGHGRKAEIWDVKSRKKLHTLTNKGDDTFVYLSGRFSPDGKLLVTGSRDGNARLWDVKMGKFIKKLKLPTNMKVRSVLFSPDSKRIFATSSIGRLYKDNNALMIDIKTDKVLQTFKHHDSYAYSASYSPDGKKIATGGSDKMIHIWDVKTGKKNQQFRGHTDLVLCINYSSDGKRMVTGSRDKTFKIWDTETGRELFTQKGHSGAVFYVSFSPDNKDILSSSVKGELKVWSAVSWGKE